MADNRKISIRREERLSEGQPFCYKEDVRKLSQPTNKVLAIFVRDYKQQSYNKCTYLSKGQKINKLPISKEIKALIQIDNDGIDA